nr:MAG TPA: Chitin oligosaccharide deacetylase [Caudoviricetes sp.]
MADRTRKLKLLRINENWQFSDDSFNKFIDDADDMLVGKDHIQDASHWTLWKPNINYTVGDIVRYTNLKSSQYAYCTVAGQTDTVEPINNVTGSIITSGTAKFQVLDIATGTSQEGVISIWLSGTYYKRGDVVQYGDVLYKCTRPHDATTFEADKNNWQEIFASLRKWKKQTFYNVGDTILNDGVAYECKTAHTSENTFKEEKWERLFEIGVEFSPLKQYYRGDIIRYARNLYKAKKDVKGNFQLADWEKVTDVIKFWDDNKNEPYLAGDTAVVHNTLVTVGNIGTTDLNSNTKPLNASIAEHDINALKYPVGIVVRKDGSIYQKIKDDKEADYTTFDEAVRQGSWKKISNNQITKFENRAYKAGEMVYHEGSIYVAKVDTGGAPVTDTSKWEALGGSGESTVNEWKPNTKYKDNQLVTFQGILLKAKAHDSQTDIDFTKFDVVFAGIKSHVKSREYGKDSVVKTQDGNLYFALQNVPKNKDIEDGNFWKRVNVQTNIKDWESNKQYLTGDIVTKNKDFYRAISDTKNATFDIISWEKLVNGDFGEWKQETDYTTGQPITINKLMVKSLANHNSGSVVPQDKYEVMYASIPQWNRSTYYPAGTLVRDVDGAFYYSITNVKDKDITPTDWVKMGSLNDWSSGNQYFAKDIVWYKNDLYRAKVDSSDSQFDVSKWEKLTQNGTIKISTYIAGKNYEVGEVIKLASADTFYYVKTNFTATTEEKDIGDTPNLAPLVAILDFDGRAYGFRDVVRYKGKLYRAKGIIKSKPEFNISEWDILNYSQAIRDWDKKTYYEKDSIITIYDVSYQVTEDFKTEDVFNSEFSYVKPQYSNIAEWREGAHYQKGVTVVSEGKLYKCINTHKSVHGGAGYIDAVDKWFMTTYPNGIGLATGGGAGGGSWSTVIPEFEIPVNGKTLYEVICRYSHWGNAGFGSFKIIRVNMDNSEEELYDGDFPPKYPVKIYDRVKSIKVKITGEHMGSGFYGDNGSLVLSDIILSYKNDNWKLIGDVTKIPDWQKYKKYEKEDVVIHNGKLYRCKKDHEDEPDFKNENWELIAGSSGTTPQPQGTVIEDWSATKDYPQGSIVIYSGKLYKAPTAISKAATFQNDWTPIDSDMIAKNWEANKKYRKDEVAYYGGSLFRAKTEHTSQTFDENNWEKLLKNISLAEWQPNTVYSKGDIVIYNSGMWRAGQNQTSDLSFNPSKWENLSGGGSGAIAGWKQITKLNAPYGTKVIINFPETLTFCFPPIDVLWLQAGTAGVVMNSYTFDVGDGNRFEYDKNLVEFDGTVHCKTEISVPMSEPSTLGSGFISMSDEINLDDYNSVDGVYV